MALAAWLNTNDLFRYRYPFTTHFSAAANECPDTTDYLTKKEPGFPIEAGLTQSDQYTLGHH